MEVVFGIISYLPDKEPDRSLREERLNRLFKNAAEVFGEINYLIIAQNWGEYAPPGFIRAKITKHDSGLGILRARNELREKFLKSGAQWLVMMDDDCIIEEDEPGAGRSFLRMLKAKRGDGFCFRKDETGEYCPSQLNLCAVSRGLYEKEPLLQVDPERNQGFEDLIWCNYLHCKYPELEFDVKGLRCTHFKNPNEKAPSTWADNERRDWQSMLDFSYGAIEEFRKGNFDWESIAESASRNGEQTRAAAEANADRAARLREALFRGWVSAKDAERFM